MDFFSELINVEKTALKIYYEKTAGWESGSEKNLEAGYNGLLHQSQSRFQIVYYNLYNGTKKTPSFNECF